MLMKMHSLHRLILKRAENYLQSIERFLGRHKLSEQLFSEKRMYFVWLSTELTLKFRVRDCSGESHVKDASL